MPEIRFDYYHSDELTVIVIAPQEPRETGRLYDAELQFKTGILAGLKITGFSIYQQRGRTTRDLTLPTRRYSVNGEGHYHLLLTPSTTDNAFAMAEAQAKVHAAIMDAVAAYESANGLQDSDAEPPIIGF